jgi:ATP-dependent DNA helicase RecQ
MNTIVTNPLLPQLDLTPARLDHLSAKVRNRVLHFLLRWECWGETLDCLAVLPIDKRVSFQDMQASALHGLGRVDQAIAVLQQRLMQREAVASRNDLARLFLAKGDTEQALTLAQSLVTTNPDYGPNWSLLGDTYLQRNDLTAAEKAYRHHQQLTPGSRQPLIGLTHVFDRRGDSVTASAYAVRSYTVNEGEFPLSILSLRVLRDFFAASHDENRVTAANEQLAQRFAAELAELNSEVAEELGGRLSIPEAQPVVPAEGQSAGNRSSSPVSLFPDLSTIPIDATELTLLAAAAWEHFRFTTFRAGQAEIMACTRRGEHVLAVLPTGAGKSLCYQLTALLDEGLTVVVSPLIALMKDQVDNLPPILRQQAIAINSNMEGSTLTQAIQNVALGHYKIMAQFGQQGAKRAAKREESKAFPR